MSRNQPTQEPTARRAGLPKQAFEPLAEGETYEPYVAASQHPAEFTLRAIVAGIIFGILFGAANAYLGLRAGLTISTSIPVAVMTVAAFRVLQRMGSESSILEANLSQTVGSASSSVASGVIFTLPALFLWAAPPSLAQMTLLAMCGGMLGILFMIPLRRFLIAREHGHLPYPEGTACAGVLVASDTGGSGASHVFWGLGIGAAFKAIVGWARAVPDHLSVPIPFLKKGEVSTDVSAALFGVGYILGPRVAAVMVGGGLLSSLIIIPAIAYWGEGRVEPLYPETVRSIAEMGPGDIWTRYVRYIGAGAVATAGIITLIKSIPTMIESFRVGAQQLRDRAAGTHDASRTDADLSLKTTFGGVAILVLVLTLVPVAFSSLPHIPARALAALLVVVAAFFFVTVSSRIVGLVGVTSNPTSGMTIATLLATSGVFLALGWTDLQGKVAALTVGCVVAIAASIAGDTSQDLKTGFLLGATPRRQQVGELLGVLTSAVFVCLTVIILADAYGFGSQELPAPQATLMKLVIDGVLQSELPWVLVAIGAAIAIVVELLRIPSLPFAVGVYLPVATMVPVFFGGLLRWAMTRSARDEDQADERRERGVLLASGFVGGEGLLGVGIAAAAGWAASRGQDPWSLGTGWAGGAAPLLAALLFAGLIGWFAWRVRRDDSPSA